MIGTPSYMAPEQSRGHALDGRTDLFSLGAILYQLTTDRPFDGPNALAVLRNLEFHQPGRVNVKRPDVPAAFSNLIMELLAKTVKDRPASAAVVAERLARPEMSRQPRLPIAPPGPAAPVPPLPFPPSVRSRSRFELYARAAPPAAPGSMLRVLFLLALAAVGFGVFWYFEIANYGLTTASPAASAPGGLVYPGTSVDVQALPALTRPGSPVI